MHKNVYTADNAAMLLIDHQVGTISWTNSHRRVEIKKNALALARIATAYQMPLVLTSSQEENVQGPLLPQLKKIAPEAFAHRIKRSGIVNAMHDENFANAVHATGRKKVIVAGITTEVCVVFPVLQLIDEGYEVQVVTDASASFTKGGDNAALRRMEQAGATITSTPQLVSELAIDWTSPKGKRIGEVMFRGQPTGRIVAMITRLAIAHTGDWIGRIFRCRWAPASGPTSLWRPRSPASPPEPGSPHRR